MIIERFEGFTVRNNLFAVNFGLNEGCISVKIEALTVGNIKFPRNLRPKRHSKIARIFKFITLNLSVSGRSYRHCNTQNLRFLKYRNRKIVGLIAQISKRKIDISRQIAECI